MKKRTSFLQKPNFRAEESDDGKLFLEGYFIVFNQETNLYADVYEEIAPESVTESLRENDIRALFNHESATVLGRTGNNTLELTADSNGLRGKIEINQNDAEAMNIYSRVKRGDINACSFGFYPTKEVFTERDDGTFHILVTEMDLLEVSPVTFPAYPQTEVAARSADVEKYKEKVAKDKFELRKKKLKERF